MPDAQGNIKGIALGGKAAETWDRIFGQADDVVRAAQRRQEHWERFMGYRADPAPEGAGSDQD